MYACVYVCVCVSELLHICQYGPSMFLPMLARGLQLFQCIGKYIRICMYVCMYTCIYAYTVCVYVHICICT